MVKHGQTRTKESSLSQNNDIKQKQIETRRKVHLAASIIELCFNVNCVCLSSHSKMRSDYGRCFKKTRSISNDKNLRMYFVFFHLLNVACCIKQTSKKFEITHFSVYLLALVK